MSSGTFPADADEAPAMADVLQLFRGCPFCGEQGAFEPNVPGIMCEGCGATGPAVSSESCNEDAGDAEVERAAWAFWNQREGGT